jgi:phospholipid/cholesterol/gamma-HCH transport system substrate-binding protein
MTPFRRNLMVGVVMLGALVLLGWMILQFGGRPAALFAPPRMPVHFTAARADGIGNGSAIFFRGVQVGRVERVRRTPDQRGVIIDAAVDRDPPLPANVEAVIRSQGLLGTASLITLELIEPEPAGQLQEGAQIQTRFVGLDLLPGQFADLAAELREASMQLRESNLIGNMADMAQAIEREVTRIGQTVQTLDELVSDPQVHEDLRASVNNVRMITERASRTAEHFEQFSENLGQMSDEASQAMRQAQSTLAATEAHVDDIGRQVGERLLQTARMLDSLQNITRKIDQGRGTAGMIVNDVRLYEALVMTSQELALTITDLRRLVEQWEQEGVTVRPR